MTSRQWTLAIPLLLVLVTLAVFWQVGSHEFVNLDDEQYVTQNPHVRGGLTAGSLAWAFVSTHASNWHPITWISHLLDVTFFGMDPRGHHWVSLLFHAANSLLLFLVLHRMTATIGKSAAVAFLFALHPLHVESVAWVAERKDVLSAFFMLWTLWFYVRYARSPSPLKGLPVLVFFALGLLSKPMLVTLPFLLLLLDYWPLGRFDRSVPVPSGPVREEQAVLPTKKAKKRKKQTARPVQAAPDPEPERQGTGIPWGLVSEKIPLFALSAVSSVVTYAVQQGGGAMSPLDAIPLGTRLGNALVSCVSYLFKTLFPQDLAVFYPYPSEIAAWKVVGAAALLAALTLLCVLFRKRFPYALVGWFWYLGTLVPVIGIVQVGMQAMADRYTYVPHIGLFIAAAWGVTDLAAGLPWGRKALAALAGVVFPALAILTWSQLAYWKNSTTLFEHALRVTERNSLAHTNLGVALNRAGKLEEAASHYREAIRINPNSSGSHFNLANYYASAGRKENALHHYREAIRINPRYTNAYNNLGLMLMSDRRADEAIPYYRKAAELEPANAGILYGYGIALAAAGHLPEAVEQFNRALALRPNYPEAHNYLGMALLMQGKREEAVGHFRQALWLKPDFTQARRNLEQAAGGGSLRGTAPPSRGP